MAAAGHATGSARTGMAHDVREAAQSTYTEARMSESFLIHTESPAIQAAMAHNASGDVTAKYGLDPAGWTHFLMPTAGERTFGDGRTASFPEATLRDYRTAIATVEALKPEATRHIEHLRDMARIDAYGMGDTLAFSDAVRWVPQSGLPVHGPAEEPIADYAARADALAGRLQRMRARLTAQTPAVERVEIIPDDDMADGTWVVYAPAEDIVLGYGFGSAAAASRWVDDTVTFSTRLSAWSIDDNYDRTEA